MVHVIASLRPAPQPVLHQSKLSRHVAGTASTTSSASSDLPDFRTVFTGSTAKGLTASAPDPPAPPPPPTAQSVFGPNPWLANPVGTAPNGTTYGYNSFYFATPETAAKVAQMVGGKVVQSNQCTPTGGAFSQQQPNQMVQLPDGRLINAGLVASFYTHGYPQSYVDMIVANEVKNA